MQIVHNLAGHSKDPTHLDGTAYSENKMLPVHQKLNDRVGLCLAYTYKMMLCYLFGNTNEAAENEKSARHYLDAIAALYPFSQYYFYRTLNMLQELEHLPPREQKTQREKIERSRKKLKLWARYGPANHLHKSKLVEAETSRAGEISGKIV